jgi:hypothetical protein
MLQQDEARDPAVRALFDVLPTAQDALGAIVLFHRIIARLDIQGAVIFEPAWLLSECFLGYPVRYEEVAMWADALLEVGLLEEYTEQGVRYAWTRTFYKNNVGLRLELEQPRYPRPPGWDFHELWPDDRAGRTPEVPNWARSGTAMREAPRTTPPSQVTLGGVAVHGASKSVRRAIERMEEALGADMAKLVRRYAMQFVEPEARVEMSLPASTYHAVLATIHTWKQEGGIYYRGQWVPWDDRRFAAAFRHAAELVIEGRMKVHKYVQELLVDPEFPPKEGEKPATAPESGSRKVTAPTTGDPVVDTHRKAVRHAHETRKRERERDGAIRAWQEQVDAYLSEHPELMEELRKAAEAEIGAVISRERQAALFERTVLSRVRLLASERAGIETPK